MTQRLVESVDLVFDPVVISATAGFEHVKDELAVIPCLLLETSGYKACNLLLQVEDARQGVEPP